jgi:hypothetical protein
VIDLYRFFIAQFSIILLKSPIHAGSEGVDRSLSPKLSTDHVDGQLSHNWCTQNIWSVGFVHHHTSGWLADLAAFDLLYRGLGFGD